MREVNKLNRRGFLRLAAATATGALAAACAPAAPQIVEVEKPVVIEKEVIKEVPVEKVKVVEKEVPVKPAEKVKIRIFVGFGTGTGEDQIRDEEALAYRFNSEREDIEVEWMITPWDEHTAKFSAMLAAGDPPDICMPIGIGGVAQFYDEDVWMDIQPYIDRDNYDMSDFYGPTVELHKYEKGTLGLPMAVYPSFIYYNKDLFDAAGVDYPPHEWGTAEWTFDKLVQVAQQLTLDSKGNNAASPGFDPNDIVQWGYDESWMDVAGLARQFGSKAANGVSDDYKTALFNTKPLVERAQWMSDAIWKWHIAASSEQSSVFYDTAGDPFESGKVAMWYCHTWMMGEAYAEAPFAWDIGAVPTGPYGDLSAQVDADTFVMPAAGKHPDEAWEVAKWMCAPGNLEVLALTWGSVPARKSGQEAFLKMLKEKFPNVDEKVLFTAIEYGDIPNHEGWLPQPSKMGDAVSAAMDLILTGENKDAQQVMEGLNKTVQGYLDEYWAQKGS